MTTLRTKSFSKVGARQSFHASESRVAIGSTGSTSQWISFDIWTSVSLPREIESRKNNEGIRNEIRNFVGLLR